MALALNIGVSRLIEEKLRQHDKGIGLHSCKRLKGNMTDESKVNLAEKNLFVAALKLYDV